MKITQEKAEQLRQIAMREMDELRAMRKANQVLAHCLDANPLRLSDVLRAKPPSAAASQSTPVHTKAPTRR